MRLSQLGRFGGYQSEFLASSFLLGLALLANIRWALTRCFDSSRRHVTDGQGDRERNRALTTMLRAVGLVAGAGLFVSMWYGYFLVQLFRGLPAQGQGLMSVILLCGLGLSEAVTALVFGEHVCSCCATPSASSQIMFSRAVGLGMVGAGWSGLIEPQLLVVNVGAILYALAVLSSGSPATLPVQFRPRVDGDGNLSNMWTSVALSQIHDNIDQLKQDVHETKARLPKETRSCLVDNVHQLMQVDAISLEVGRGLVTLVDPREGEKLLERVTSIRRHVAMELGFVVSALRCRNNLQLKPDTYVIKIDEVEVAQGEVHPGLFLAIGPEGKLRHLIGKSVTDPTYGMPGVWIDSTQRQSAERFGCMIFDSVSVIATQLTEVISTHAHELLGLTEVRKLLEHQDPALVGEVVPDRVSLVELRDILRSLLQERVSIRNLGVILDQLAGLRAELSAEEKIEFVRVALCRQICKEYQNNEGTINVITVEPSIEKTIQESLKKTDQGTFLLIDPNVGQEILEAISYHVESLQEKGLQPILLTSPPLRSALRKLTERSFPNLVILSWNEIAPKVNVNSVAMVQLTTVE
jgi:flagellar biosynthesis component FlhA